MNKRFLDRRISCDTLNHLLNMGDWHLGLISKDCNIFSNTELWPQYPENLCGDIIWKNEYGELKPIVWFGTNDAIKDSCLAIFDRKKIKVDVGYDYMEIIQAFSM